MAEAQIDLSSADISEVAHRLRDRLRGELPGTDAQVHMAPRYTARRNALSIQGRDCREAGVLALLYPDPDPHLVLTVRRDDLPDHPGQISFPGGQREAGETLPETALREAEEEVGLDPALCRVEGELGHLSTVVSKSYIVPVVARVADRPSLVPRSDEADRVFWLPIAELTRPGTYHAEVWGTLPMNRRLHFFHLDDETIWGATAHMLVDLLTRAL